MPIGIDLRGTKIAAAALERSGKELAAFHNLVPHDYEGTRDMLFQAVQEL